MAMRDGTRRWAIRSAWAALLIAGAMLVGLRVGRPLWYTDGLQPIDARQLAAAGMVKWGAPEIGVELPGPVVGRVAELPDGRLVYGRGNDDGTTDLVTFDPTRPTLSPEPAFGLNTPANELAPAVAANGRLFFASDRAGGVGGYDLYVAAIGPSGFGAPEPVVLCNTARDETDPAPHPDGSTFVFVRIDPQVDEGRGGTLFRCRLTDGLDPAPVFADEIPARSRHVDRDPAFAANGGALWFVRKARGQRLHLVRASQLGAVFDAPRTIGLDHGSLELRSPTPSADGMRLSLLLPARPGAPGDFWYRSTATELYPWWPGQRWLEWLLLGAILVSALLLVLLHLGRRWSSLDFVAQCLLLSLLLHVLLFLWLWRVEIEGAPLVGDEADGAMQVSLREPTRDGSATAADAPASGEGDRELAAAATFATSERALGAAAPVVTPERADRAAITAAAAERDSAAAAREIDVREDVADAAAELARRDGRDVAAAVAEAAVEPVAARPVGDADAAAADRERAAPSPVATSAPERTVDRPAIDPSLVAGDASPAAAPRTAAPIETADPRLADAPSDGALAASRDGTDAAGAPVVATAHEVNPLAPAAAGSSRDRTAPAAGAAPAAPDATVPRVAAGAPRVPVASIGDVAAPAARALDPAAALREEAAASGLRTAGAAPVRPATAAPTPSIGGARAAPVAAERSAASTPAAAPAGDLAVPDTRLAPSAARTAPAAPERSSGVATATPKSAIPLRTTPRDGATPAAAAETAALRAAAAKGGAPLAPLATPLRGENVASPTAARDAASTPDRAGLLVPTTGIDRSARSSAGAPVAERSPQPTAAPSRRGGVAVALREGDAAAVVAAPAPSKPAVGAPLASSAAAATPNAPGVAAALPATARTRSPAAPDPAVALPPGSQLQRSGASLAPTADGPAAPRQPVATVPARPRAALQDGTAPVAVVRAPAPAQSATAAPTLPVAIASLEPLASAWIETPRRVAPPKPASTDRTKVVPPGTSLDRGTLAPMGTTAEPLAAASAYSNRFGPAKAKAIEEFGGSVETERAVANGLRYLASIQSEAGTWGDRDQFDPKYGSVYVGKTALCVLAFLGAGHTPTSRTEYSENVARAIDHLLSLQDPDTGAFGPSSCYGHGIATYALAECYGITKNEKLQRPIEEALTWILQNQGPRRDRRNRGGWGYFSPGLRPEDDYARVSVSAWMIMALESARLSGVELPTDVLPRAREYLELSFDQTNGWFRYNHKPSRLNSAWPTLPASTPAGAFCLMLLQAPADDPKVRVAVDYTVERRPEAYRRYGDDDFVLRGQGNVYFWYYGTLCCFLAGGDAWKQWNERLRVVLPAAQAKDGSFPPIDAYSREAGDNQKDRSYTTAMCVLSLEIYYRYFTPLLIGR